ncbi:MAG: hypothetical protein IJ675_01665 [Pseudobutyrivibrio sp.]|nr:hypothetical protein [Pseudobutyrivibrio sp.]
MIGISAYSNFNPIYSNPNTEAIAKDIKAEGGNELEAKGFVSERAAKRAGVIECETCASRKYQDGSDEEVSFKSAQHISPNAAAARVRGHEQEHVSNAYDKAKQEGGKVLNASVAIHTAICPECGRTYVSGGTTTTQIKYPNEDNPYQKGRKAADAGMLAGMNFDAGV